MPSGICKDTEHSSFVGMTAGRRKAYHKGPYCKGCDIHWLKECLPNVLFCPCCGTRLRPTPRVPKFKKKFKEQSKEVVYY